MNEKAWGTTECLISGPLYSRHRLAVKTGGYSSVHYHVDRANRFIVESGSIAVAVFYAWRVERHVLTVDNTLDVSSLVPHQFQVLEDGIVVEEYWPDRGGSVREDDIVRLCKGGSDCPSEIEGLAEWLIWNEVQKWACRK